MDQRIKNELTKKNAMIVGGTVLTVFFWKEILVLGAVAGGWFLWKNRSKIQKVIHPAGKNS